KDQRGSDSILIGFALADCGSCPSRPLCTRATTGRRSIAVRPQPQYEALQRARERQKSPLFAQEYAARAGSEGTISQGVSTCGMRRCRYIGPAKAHLQNLCTATALNVIRLVGWLHEVPLAKTKRSAFARLAVAA